MHITKFLLWFFMIFFSLQLFLGEAGLIALIQEKQSTKILSDNIQALLDVNVQLNRQVALTKHNKSYLLMNAHRVGLIAEDEFLIKTETPLFSSAVIYSPGTIILEKKPFAFSNFLLFLFSILMLCWLYAYKIFKKSVRYFEKNSNNNQHSTTSPLANDYPGLVINNVPDTDHQTMRHTARQYEPSGEFKVTEYYQPSEDYQTTVQYHVSNTTEQIHHS